MWANFLCSTVLLSVSYTVAFPYYGQPFGKFPMSQPLHYPWWYEPRLMLPQTYLPSVFARCLAAVPKMLALPLMPPNYFLLQRYDPPPFCDPEPEYFIRIYVPEKVENKSVNVLQQAEEPNANEATAEAPVPEKPSEGPQENHVPVGEDAVLENAQEPDAQKHDDAQELVDDAEEHVDDAEEHDDAFAHQTTPVPEVLIEEEMTTETPDAIDISRNNVEEGENPPSLVKDTPERTDELKAAENEIEDVKTQEMEKGKEDKIDEGNSKVDVLKADLYRISDTDQSLTSNSL